MSQVSQSVTNCHIPHQKTQYKKCRRWIFCVTDHSPYDQRMLLIISTTSAPWQSGNTGEKSIEKYPTLEIDFSVSFYRKRINFCMRRLTCKGIKGKKRVGGVFHRQEWSQFKPFAKRNLFRKTNICVKHPLIAKK